MRGMFGLVLGLLLAGALPAHAAPAMWPRALTFPHFAPNEKIRDLVDLLNGDAVILEGTGIVIGLQGTGDKSTAAIRALREYLQANQDFRLEGRDLAAGNTALVHVTAEMPANITAGQFIPVAISTYSDAKSLKGGRLLMTSLVDPLAGDGQVVAQAIGNVQVGAQQLTNGYIPVSKGGGAKVLRNRAQRVVQNGELLLLLKQNSAADASRIAAVVNRSTANPYASFEDADRTRPIANALTTGKVLVRVPRQYWGAGENDFLAAVLDLDVDVEQPPRILINRATNQITVTGAVRVQNAMVSLNNKTITLRPPDPAQPDERPEYLLAAGAPRSLVELDGPETMSELNALVHTLSAWGLTTEDHIKLFQDLIDIGAIRAELIVQ